MRVYSTSAREGGVVYKQTTESIFLMRLRVIREECWSLVTGSESNCAMLEKAYYNLHHVQLSVC